MRTVLWVSSFSTLVACGGAERPDDVGLTEGAVATDADDDDDDAGTSSDDDPPETSGNPGTSGAGTSGPGSTSSSGTDTDSDDDSGGPVLSVCERWIEDRASLDEGTWAGNAASCNAGAMPSEGREHALALVNLYRFMAGLPEIEVDPTLEPAVQACALIQDVNRDLAGNPDNPHEPPPSWQCWSEAASSAAHVSNIAQWPAVTAVDRYMTDNGNEATLGHRRWILSGSMTRTAFGSTDWASCMWVAGGGGGGGGPSWTAWPPPGEFPLEAATLGGGSIDQTGWSLQSDAIPLQGASVQVFANDQPVSVDVVPLAPGIGSSSAIAIVPVGFSLTVGTTYRVEVSGTTQPIEYAFEVTDCAASSG